LRTLLALNGHTQPQEDIHEWNIANIYNGTGSREEAKKSIFAWLYNPESQDKRANKYYDRDAVQDKYFHGDKIINTFGREIKRDKDSKILCCLHDSVVLDMTNEDCKKHLREIVEMFGNTQLGNYLVNVRVGKNYGEMNNAKV
jgi:hypothetical protein